MSSKGNFITVVCHRLHKSPRQTLNVNFFGHEIRISNFLSHIKVNSPVQNCPLNFTWISLHQKASFTFFVYESEYLENRKENLLYYFFSLSTASNEAFNQQSVTA
jgi:hypothetical protein